MTNTLVPPKVTPSDEQVRLVVDAIEGWPNAELLATMHPRGEMILSMTEDELTTTAWFNREGVIIGDWV